MALIDDIADTEIKRVTKYALANRLSINMVKEIADGTRIIDNNPNYVLHLPQGITATYTIEEHMGGWYNHISVAINEHISINLATKLAAYIAHNQVCQGSGDSDCCLYTIPGKSIHVLLPFCERIPLDAFRSHVSSCKICHEDDMNLCDVGTKLLKEVSAD
jgi:hypothetical protein